VEKEKPTAQKDGAGPLPSEESEHGKSTVRIYEKKKKGSGVTSTPGDRGESPRGSSFGADEGTKEGGKKIRHTATDTEARGCRVKSFTKKRLRGALFDQVGVHELPREKESFWPGAEGTKILTENRDKNK